MEDGRGGERGGKREGDGIRRGEEGMRGWKRREERMEGEGGGDERGGRREDRGDMGGGGGVMLIACSSTCVYAYT